MTTRHGQLEMRGINAPQSRFHEQGRFGRLFPNLPPLPGNLEHLRAAMREIGKDDGLMEPKTTPENLDNPAIPAGFTFFGQFVDHDITFDPTSSLEQQADPEAIQNFRTPLLELDSVYGAGPAANPHLYDSRPNMRGKLLIDEDFPHDLPRNSQGIALIGDPRNDENNIVSQIQHAFLMFHNAAIDFVAADGQTPPSEIFNEAQRLVRWHYQWIVVHEFLPLICGQSVVEDVLENGRCFYNWRNDPFIPVEFAVAAYRFGHTQVRPGYRLNAGFAGPIFAEPGSSVDLSGGKRLPVERKIEFHRFFDTGTGPATERQQSKRIDTLLSPPLFRLPFIPPPDNSLAGRNLLRHLTFNLPSGQAVARAMSVGKAYKKIKLKDVEPLPPSAFKDLKNIGTGLNLDQHTPLWFYILREADKRADGKSLGPMGGRIVAEVFIGLLDGDRLSYRRADPQWKPIFGTNSGEFKMADLLKFAKLV
ncbi:MAG TPA: heme peroxidase family protein [Thermoanaerobaculia bacterium]|nr:heme peroxidase family protein [Thermoanaerobaculia bacterium]